jgi:hypothetical protein
MSGCSVRRRIHAAGRHVADSGWHVNGDADDDAAARRAARRARAVARMLTRRTYTGPLHHETRAQAHAAVLRIIDRRRRRSGPAGTPGG